MSIQNRCDEGKTGGEAIDDGQSSGTREQEDIGNFIQESAFPTMFGSHVMDPGLLTHGLFQPAPIGSLSHDHQMKLRAALLRATRSVEEEWYCFNVSDQAAINADLAVA